MLGFSREKKFPSPIPVVNHVIRKGKRLLGHCHKIYPSTWKGPNSSKEQQQNGLQSFYSIKYRDRHTRHAHSNNIPNNFIAHACCIWQHFKHIVYLHLLVCCLFDLVPILDLLSSFSCMKPWEIQWTKQVLCINNTDCNSWPIRYRVGWCSFTFYMP